MRKLIFAILLVSISSLTITKFQPAHAMGYFDQSAKIEKLEGSIEASNSAIQELKEKNNFLFSELDWLQVSLQREVDLQAKRNDFFYQVGRIFPEKIDITPGEEHYQMLASHGMLMSVRFVDIKAHSTGSNLTLRLVNFYSIIGQDLEFILTYSKEINSYDIELSYEENQKRIEDHEKFKKIKTQKVNEMKPGVGTEMVIFIPNYKPDEVKYISISATQQAIRYYGKPK